MSRREEKKSFVADIMIPGIVGVFSKGITYPLDGRLKTIVQSQIANDMIKPEKRYIGIRCLPRIVSEQGFFSLWRGYFPVVL